MSTSNEKQEEQKVKRYSSLGQIVREGDLEALHFYIDKFKQNNDFDALLSQRENHIFSQMDELLWHASEFKDNEKALDVVEALVSYGANPNMKDKSGITLFMKAAEDNNVALMDLLVNKFNINLNEEDYGFHDVAYHITQKDSVEALEFIVKLGYDVDKQDIYGRTVLHLAAGVPAEKCVDKLIEINANPLIKDKGTEHAIASQYVPNGDDWDELFEKLESYAMDYQKKLEAVNDIVAAEKFKM